MRILTAERVNEILRDSLYRDEELTREDAIRVKGIVQNFGFHPERLKAYQEEIKNLIACLPDAFVSGGGWTFLNLCTDKDGNLWGQHNNCEELYCLAAGLRHGRILHAPGYVECASRWSALHLVQLGAERGEGRCQ